MTQSSGALPWLLVGGRAVVLVALCLVALCLGAGCSDAVLDGPAVDDAGGATARDDAGRWNAEPDGRRTDADTVAVVDGSDVVPSEAETCLDGSCQPADRELFFVCAGGDGTLPKASACATAWDLSHLDDENNWASDPGVDGKVGPSDDVVFLDDGGWFRGKFSVHSSGRRVNRSPFVPVWRKAGSVAIGKVQRGRLGKMGLRERLPQQSAERPRRLPPAREEGCNLGAYVVLARAIIGPRCDLATSQDDPEVRVDLS